MIHDIQDFNERMRDERIARNCRWLKYGVWAFIVALTAETIRQAMGV
ncbi:hypothetical protein [Cupriavidus gilardii]|nr:hypothetical protein [Cupriavidus gilardii]QKS60860.1 hypothetical protein FOB47_02505 [Cupriavidus gilardii]